MIDNYECNLKEALINLRLGAANEYAKICLESGVETNLISLTNNVSSFIDLCDEARKQQKEIMSGTYSKSRDVNYNINYLEIVQIRYSALLDKLRASELSRPEQSTLILNILLYLGNIRHKNFSFINGSYDFLHKIMSDLNDDDLLIIYNKLNSIRYPYIKNVKAIIDSRGLQADRAKSGGCYVATCVYGSYDCPQVWTLRRFRDEVLSNNIFGKIFIKIYYAVSPSIVKIFGSFAWFHKMFKAPLDKLVSSLQSKGIDNTPYEDI